MNDKRFLDKIEKMRHDARVSNFLNALEIIQSHIKTGKVLSISFTMNKEYGEPDDSIIVDYSVDLNDGRNIGDLNFETFEDAITDMAKELKTRISD